MIDCVVGGCQLMAVDWADFDCFSDHFLPLAMVYLPMATV
jgi:hypothetical protein